MAQNILVIDMEGADFVDSFNCVFTAVSVWLRFIAKEPQFFISERGSPKQ